MYKIVQREEIGLESRKYVTHAVIRGMQLLKTGTEEECIEWVKKNLGF